MGNRTKYLTSEDWQALHRNGVAKVVNNHYQVDAYGLVQVLTSAVLSHQVDSRTQFESDAITLDELAHGVCGLPQVERTEPSDCDDWVDPAITFKALIKGKLRTMYDGKVQSECMARGLVLVTEKVRRDFVGLDTGITGTQTHEGWACTDNADVMAALLVEPEIKRRMSANKKRTLNALEQVRAVPEIAARVIAGMDSEIATVGAVRQRTYTAAAAGLNAKERAALDASISSYGDEYLAANNDTLVAIAEDQPSHLELESSGS